MDTKYTVTVECKHVADRKWWILGDRDIPAFERGSDERSGMVTVYLRGCDGCTGMAEIAGIRVDGPVPDPRETRVDD